MKDLWRRTVRAAVCAVALLAAAAGAARAEEGAEDSPPSIGPVLDGSLRLRYDGRFFPDSGDNDHRLVQSLDVSAAETWWGHFRLHLSGDLVEDLDGDGDPADRTFSAHEALWDSRIYGYLYQAIAEVSDLGPLRHARLGRQFVARELPAWFDGADVRFGLLERRLDLHVYGGIPVREFGTDDYFDDVLAGAGAAYAFESGTRLSAEYQLWHRAAEPSESWHQAVFAVRQRLSDRLDLLARFGLLDDAARDLELAVSWLPRGLDLSVDVRWYWQIVWLDWLPAPLGPFGSLLGSQKPYHRVSLDLRKGFLDGRLTLAGGGDLRLLDDGEAESTFNRSFHHEYLMLVLSGFGPDGLEVSIHGDLWQALGDPHADLTVTGGGDIRYRRPGAWQAAVGGFYSLYRYDWFLDGEERQHAYTLFAEGRCHPLDWLFLEARYSLDIADRYEHRLSLAAGHQF